MIGIVRDVIMAETATAVAAAAPSAATVPTAKTDPKKKAKGGGDPKKPKTPAAHPPVSEMVLAAVESLKERKGSSLQAIKKYIAANYKCDVARLSAFIRKALKAAVEKGTLVQTKGTGASGSFKLKAAEKATVTGEKKQSRKGTATKKQQTTAGDQQQKKKAKKPAGAKKAKPGGGGTAKKTKAAGASAAPKQKATKPSKAAAKKPKTPKPKKAAGSPKKAAPKKATAAKK